MLRGAAAGAQATSGASASTHTQSNVFLVDASDDPPLRDEHFLRGTTDFMRAAALLEIEKVETMLAAGTDDVDTSDVLGQTPLLLLSRNRYSQRDVPRAIAVIKHLLAAVRPVACPSTMLST